MRGLLPGEVCVVTPLWRLWVGTAIGVVAITGVRLEAGGRTLMVTWACSASPLSVAIIAAVSKVGSSDGGRWNAPMIEPFLSETTGVESSDEWVVPIKCNMTFVPWGSQLLPLKAMISPILPLVGLMVSVGAAELSA